MNCAVAACFSQVADTSSSMALRRSISDIFGPTFDISILFLRVLLGKNIHEQPVGLITCLAHGSLEPMIGVEVPTPDPPPGEHWIRYQEQSW